MFQNNWYVVIQKGSNYRMAINCDTGGTRYWRTKIGALIATRRYVKDGDVVHIRDARVCLNDGVDNTPSVKT